MNRDEITEQYFDIKNTTVVVAYSPKTLKEANKLWWKHSSTKSFRLTSLGYEQFFKNTPDELRVKPFQVNTLYTGRVILSLDKLKSPWYCNVVYDFIDEFWVLGQEESVCMAMCGGKLNKFLDAWELSIWNI